MSQVQNDTKVMPILITEVRLSEKTSQITGFSTVEQLVKGRAGLFTDLSDGDFTQLFDTMYGEKLKASDRIILDGYTKEEKRTHAISALTLQLTLNQEIARLQGDAPVANLLGMLIGNRINVSNSTSTKFYWQTATLDNYLKLGFTVGADFSELMAEQGVFTYIKREHSFTPEIRNGKVVSSPKRAGKGGDILTLEDKLIFTHSKIVSVPFDGTVDGFKALYAQNEAAEIANAAAFKHDNSIDIVLNTDIPMETRDKKTGAFNDEFQAWLHEYLNIKDGVQTEIAA